MHESERSISYLVDHVDHLAQTIGVAHICLGADFVRQLEQSGAFGVVEPHMAIDGLAGPEEYPALFEALRNRGYGEADLQRHRERQSPARAAQDAARVGSARSHDPPPDRIPELRRRRAQPERADRRSARGERDRRSRGRRPGTAGLGRAHAGRRASGHRGDLAEARAPARSRPGRPGLAIERTAVNLFDFPDPDNDGAQPVDVPIEPGAPVAYFATLPLRRIVAAWQAAGIPGYLSESAGLFLCNAAMYSALHATAAGGPPAGFLHLPSLPEEVAGQREQPSMALATQIEGVRLALEESVAALAA